jgi:quinolinate synthase
LGKFGDNHLRYLRATVRQRRHNALLNKQNMNKQNRIQELKEKRNAVILAHYYTLPEIQDIADYLGDSLFLAQKAKETNADTILFCGVNFMAETAKILNPTKTVLLPDDTAGCSLADFVDVDDFLKWKNSFENPYLISYINCSTTVKAISDVICTSANVLKIAQSAPKNATILFAPDENLGDWVNKTLGLNMKTWKGDCCVHIDFSEKHLRECIKNEPDAEVVAHPECPENILNYANFVGSTTAILNYVKKSEKNKFIILTETGILHQMKRDSPDKIFITVNGINSGSENICLNMKKNTLDKVIFALENLQPEIVINEKLRFAALKPLEKMLEQSK